MRLLRLILLLGLCQSAAVAATQPAGSAEAEACDSLDDCIARVLATATTRRQLGEAVEARLATFGDEAADRLVPLLMYPDLCVREAAGMALTGLSRIDPRHLPALVEAWRRGDIINHRGHGNGWLPVPIARTGTDEALRLLWEDFLSEARGNDQVRFALAQFGDRLRPLVSAEMADCASRWRDQCNGLVSLLNELDLRWPRPIPPVIPGWGIQALIGWTQARAPHARSVAAEQLGRLRHPAGREPLQRQLAELRVTDPDSLYEAKRLIRQVAAFGPSATASAPVVARYLDARYSEDLRAAAALALGSLGDSAQVPALLALAPELTDDWVLAYNATESLGRLRAAEAVPLLNRVAREHWHRGVRNNAMRALNMIAGGSFARADVAGDGAPYPPPLGQDGEEYLYMGELRYAGDDASDWCGGSDEAAATHVPQDPVGSLGWPTGSGGRIALGSVAAATARAVRTRISGQEVQGDVVAVLPVHGGALVAFNGGEFGGGVYFLPNRGSARPLLRDPVHALWLMGGRLYVAAGLAHLVLDLGQLYVVDPVRMRVERVVRLPASPQRLSASIMRAVIIETDAGDLAVREDGTLADAEDAANCGAAG